MRKTAEMKKLPHIIMVLYLVIVPASQGKSITSREFPYKHITGRVIDWTKTG